MNRLLIIAPLLLWLAAGTVSAEQSKQFDRYTIHYNALTTNQLSPEIARAYGLTRSPNRAMVNITVLEDGAATRAEVKVTARNLTGQLKSVEIREVLEPEDAVYYLGEFGVSHMETMRFTVQVKPQGSTSAPYQFEFQQQFYTE